MPPKAKASPLAAIRRQVARRQRDSAVLLRYSAYSKYSQKNKELIHGKKRSISDDEDGHGDEDEDGDAHGRRNSLVMKEPVRKKAKKIQPQKPKPAPKPRSPTPEAIIESWRPAGGHEFSALTFENSSSPAMLGIARVSTWQVPAFIADLRKKIEVHAKIEDVLEQVLEHGGESVTDVSVKFESERVAGMVWGQLEGELVLGRRLRLKIG